MLSVFNSIWPVPIGFLLALLVIMAFFFRKKLFGCLKGKHSSVESGTYRQNGELNAGLDPPNNTDSGIRLESTSAPGVFFGQQSDREITPSSLILPNHPRDISIISSPINPTLRCGNQSERNDLEPFDVHEAPPPSYSSLFYCPPPKYEDVVVIAQ